MTGNLKCEQVFRLLSEKIASGEFTPGCRIPSEPELSAQLGVGRNTLRSALARLEEQRLLLRLRKSGTFVASADSEQMKRLFSLYSPVIRRNFKHRILVLVENNTHGSSYTIGNIAKEYASTKGAEVFLQDRIFFRTGKFEDRCRWVEEQHFTGIIEAAHTLSPNDPVLELPDHLSIPIVMPFAWGATDLAIVPFFVIPFSSRLAILKGVNYLFRKGHRKFGFISLDSENSGFHNITIAELMCATMQDKILLLEGGESIEATEPAIEKLLAVPERPSALVCYNCSIAIAAMECLKSRGIRVPEDIAVIGYGDSNQCDCVSPTITSISVRLKDRAIAAVDFLLAGDYRQEALPQLPAIIQERESTM